MLHTLKIAQFLKSDLNTVLANLKNYLNHGK